MTGRRSITQTDVHFLAVARSAGQGKSGKPSCLEDVTALGVHARREVTGRSVAPLARVELTRPPSFVPLTARQPPPHTDFSRTPTTSELFRTPFPRPSAPQLRPFETRPRSRSPWTATRTAEASRLAPRWLLPLPGSRTSGTSRPRNGITSPEICRPTVLSLGAALEVSRGRSRADEEEEEADPVSSTPSSWRLPSSHPHVPTPQRRNPLSCHVDSVQLVMICCVSARAIRPSARLPAVEPRPEAARRQGGPAVVVRSSAGPPSSRPSARQEQEEAVS